jgi:hypothetical protein
MRLFGIDHRGPGRLQAKSGLPCFHSVHASANVVGRPDQDNLINASGDGCVEPLSSDERGTVEENDDAFCF